MNSYVLYRQNNEWRDGRVSGISADGAKNIYRICSFHTFDDVAVAGDESVLSATAENKRKIKTQPFIDAAPGQVHVPPTLYAILLADKEYAAASVYPLPAATTVGAVLAQAREFLTDNSSADHDEILEVCAGFAYVFNRVLKDFLLYEGERAQAASITLPPAEVYGPMHLLRLVYFLQARGHKYLPDAATRRIMLEYTVLLLDFLLVRQNELF